MVAKNWIPLWKNHYPLYLKQIALGLIFTLVFFLVFRYLILKFDILTPGREDENALSKLYTKKDYKAKKANENKFSHLAEQFLVGLGGKENIESVTNCATRLRVKVVDVSRVLESEYFKANGALGVVRKNLNFQIIIGPSVPQVKDEFEKLI